MLPDSVRRAFDLTGPAIPLAGGTAPVFRVDDVIVKPLHPMMFENPHSLVLAPWLAEQVASLAQNGFRLAEPVRALDGRWVVAGWIASTYLAGHPATAADIPAILPAFVALHRALEPVPHHPLLDDNDSAWGVAHRHCWGNRPAWVHPALESLVNALYARLRSVPDLPAQIIHGDPNPFNILIAPDQPPGFIDLTPFWSSVDFAVGMLANWIGPREGDAAALSHFAHLPHFDQLLLRAAIRMLLIVSELGGVNECASERRAAEIVLSYVDS